MCDEYNSYNDATEAMLFLYLFIRNASIKQLQI